MRSVFWWLNLVRLDSLYKILYPKRRIESYSIMGTIVSPNKILLKWMLLNVGDPNSDRIPRFLASFVRSVRVYNLPQT